MIRKDLRPTIKHWVQLTLMAMFCLTWMIATCTTESGRNEGRCIEQSGNKDCLPEDVMRFKECTTLTTAWEAEVECIKLLEGDQFPEGVPR